MKAPFPYFGGKRAVADRVWAALGDVRHYIEPFCGSCAVLLMRPTWHKHRVETVNDADGHLANVWRALQFAPDEVARWCDWPVNHADLQARKLELNAGFEQLAERVNADAKYYDARLAGYYIWCASCWIGSGLICPGQIPHVSDAGKGVHAAGRMPHVSDAGTGVHAAGQRMHLGDNEADVRDPYNTRLFAWFRELAARLRYVRVVCGDWTQVCGGSWQTKLGPCGIFFDPPYSDVAERDMGVYTVDCGQVAHAVRAWCLERGGERDMRIVLAGYYEEHESLLDAGWSVERWSAQGGYSSTSRNETRGKVNRHREALFFSPHCRREPSLYGELCGHE